MTDISLYEGCWVKTQNGDIIGPVRATFVTGIFNGAWGVLSWTSDGTGRDFSGTCGPLRVVSVYPTLAAASAANPEM